MQYPKVLNVSPQKDYTVIVTFESGEIKKFNVKPYISGNWFGQLMDLDIFNTVRPCGNTIGDRRKFCVKVNISHPFRQVLDI